MAEPAERVELAIDSASPVASVAVTRAGVLLAELTWRTRAGHAAELLSAIEATLAQAGVEREQIAALFVDRGPGGYAGLRVGVSTAMGIALGLSADLLGAGRLDIDAYPHAAYPGPVCALHQAGRGDLAWAVYEGHGADRREVAAPRLTTLDALLREGPREALYCGDVAGLEEALCEALPNARFAPEPASLRRAGTLAALCWARYTAGARDDPAGLEPLYMRDASITRPKPRAAAGQR